MELPYSKLAGRTAEETIRAQCEVQRQAKLNPLLRTHTLSDKVQLNIQGHWERDLL